MTMSADSLLRVASAALALALLACGSAVAETDQMWQPPDKAAQRPAERATRLLHRAPPVHVGMRRPRVPTGVAGQVPLPDTPAAPSLGAGEGAATAQTNAPPPTGSETPNVSVPVADAPMHAAPAQAAAADPPASAASFRVAVLGDDMAGWLGQGLRDAYTDRPDVDVVLRTRDASGLVHDAGTDWAKVARDLATGPHVGIALVMVGINDRQPLTDTAGAAVAPLSPRWRELYAARVDAVTAPFRERHIPVVWVGTPIIKDESASADMLALNAVIRDAAAKAQAGYVDVWEAFADDAGHFATFGPDINGQAVRLRSADGLHFTAAGALKLAHFTDADLHRAMDDAKAAEAAQRPAVPATVALVPSSEGDAAVAKPNGGFDLFVPAPAIPGQVVIPVKPLVGPVVSLTAPVSSPGGALVERTGLTSPAVTSGTVEPRPGRGDDFAWPRR